MSEPPEPLVAVVDDDRTVLESLENLLESAGYAVRLFSSGEALLESGALQAVSCLISDLCMPGMDGWMIERRVALERPDLPIIFITGNDAAWAQAAASRAEGRPPVVLTKPFDGPRLLAALRQAVAERP